MMPSASVAQSEKADLAATARFVSDFLNCLLGWSRSPARNLLSLEFRRSLFGQVKLHLIAIPERSCFGSEEGPRADGGVCQTRITF
jgi:hypothetical protein